MAIFQYLGFLAVPVFFGWILSIFTDDRTRGFFFGFVIVLVLMIVGANANL